MTTPAGPSGLFGIASRLSGWLAVAAVGLLVCAVLVTAADILLRLVARISLNLFDLPLNLIVPGNVDITQLFIMGAAWLAMPWAFLSGGQVAVDLVTDRLPPRLAALSRLAAGILGFFLMAGITFYGFGKAMRQIGYGDTSHTIGIPIVWYWGPLLVGAGLSVVAAALLAARAAGDLTRPEPPRRSA